MSVSETKRSVELEEATVKQITGNDTISARAPYGQPFAYRPQFKLWMSTNHKPEIPDGSEAIWDRLRLIPFTQRFDGNRADPDLPEKLREELPGVLAWAVTGCVTWHRDGLGSSKAVDRATAEYRAETDVLERFFEDECQFGPKLQITKSALWEAWQRWCDSEGEEEGTQVGFSRIMKERGIVKGFFEPQPQKKPRIWVGIGLTPPPEEGGVVSPDPGEQTKNASEKVTTPPSRSIVGGPQNPCKQGGVVDDVLNYPNNLETYSENPFAEESSEKTAKVGVVGNIPPVRGYEVHYHEGER